MNEKSNEKKIEISVEYLVAFRDLLSEYDTTNREKVDITDMSLYDYDRALVDATFQDYVNYWMKIRTAFFAMCVASGVPTLSDRLQIPDCLDFDKLCK